MSAPNKGINPSYAPYCRDYVFCAGPALSGPFTELSVLWESLVVIYAHSALLLLVFPYLVDTLK